MAQKLHYERGHKSGAFQVTINDCQIILAKEGIQNNEYVLQMAWVMTAQLADVTFSRES